MKDWTGKGEPRRAGKDWVYDYIKHLPDGYSRILQKPQEIERTASEHYSQVKRWFINLKIAMDELKITPVNLYNFDKTRFIVGQGKKEAVVIKYLKTLKRISSLSSHKSLTVVKCINAEGKVIPPLIIPKGERHMEEQYNHIKDDNWLIAPASSGFIIDEIAFKQL